MRETVQGVKRVSPRRSNSVPAPVVQSSGLCVSPISLRGRWLAVLIGGCRLQVGDLVGLRDRLGVLL